MRDIIHVEEEAGEKKSVEHFLPTHFFCLFSTNGRIALLAKSEESREMKRDIARNIYV